MKYEVKDYNVKEVADYYGISAQTIRIYDKKGLLPSGKNEVNGYRTYTREDVLTMEYIFMLKKMRFSLDEIRRIVNEVPLEKVAEMMDMQRERLEAEVCELQHLIGYITDYHEKLCEVMEYEKNREEKQKARIEIVTAPPFIIKEVTTDMEEAMESFRWLDSDSIPLMTIEIDVEDVRESMRKRNAGALITNRENRMNRDYKLSLVDEKNLSKGKNFDFRTFRITESCKAVYTVLSVVTNRDYERIEEVFSFIREEQYEICGNALVRSIANCYCDRASTEYIEIWIPVQRKE